MPDRGGAVKVFGPCQAPLQTNSFKSESIFSALESFKRPHSNGTMICAELFSSVMNDSNFISHKQTRKKHKGRNSDVKVHSGPLEPIHEEDMYAEDPRKSKGGSQRLNDVSSMEAIKRESLRVRRSRLEEDVLRLHKRLQSELDLREAFEYAMSDAFDVNCEHLPGQVQELMYDITSLEVSVLKLEEELLACQWRLSEERKARIMLQRYAGVSTSSSREKETEEEEEEEEEQEEEGAPTPERNLFQSFQKLKLQEELLHQGVANSEASLSPATPETLRRSRVPSRNAGYSDAESVDQEDSLKDSPGDNLALVAFLGERDTSRRLSFRSNVSDEDYLRSFSTMEPERCDSFVSDSFFSEEGERLKYRRHHKLKKSRQKHLELVTGARIPHALLPATPPQEVDEPLRSSFRRRSSGIVFRGLALHPNKLSEKMLRCMMDIYFHLSDSAPVTTSSSPTSPFTQAITTSSVSSLSESSFLSFGRSPLVELSNKDDVVGSESLFDPYRCREKLSWTDIGVYGSSREIRWISVGKEQLGYAARALRDYKLLVEQLARVDILSMAHEEKLAFWINIYNALLMHGYLAYGIPKSELKCFFLMQKASYVIGGHAFTALAIEYHLLKHKAPAHRPQIALLLALHKVKLTAEQSKLAIDYPEPLSAFALSCGARSSPLVKVYTAENVIQQLKSSLHDYIRASVGLGVRGKLLVPKLLYVYAHETMDDSSMLGWIYLHLPSSQVSLIQRCLQQRRHRFLASRSFAILPFDFRFQYLFLPS